MTDITKSSSLGPSIKLGRLPYGFFHNVERIRWDGDDVEFSGYTAEATDRENLAVMREQLLGTSSSLDTPVVPLICRDDPWRTTYLSNVTVGVEDPAGADRLRRLPYTVRGRRVPGRDAPLFELLQLGGYRSNSISIVEANTQPWHGVPAAVVDYWDGESADYDFTVTRTCETAADGVGIGVYSTTGNARRLATYSLPVANFYDGAATLTIGGNVVTGRQVWDTDANTNEWSLTNGICTVSAGAFGSEGHQFQIVGLDTAGTATTTKNFRWYFDDVGSQVPDSFTTLTVIQNRPEVVAIRLGMRVGADRYRIVMDVTLRRGSRLAEFTWRIDEDFVVTVDRGATADSATSITGGIKDASGTNRWIMVSPNTVSKSTGQGSMALSSAGTRLSAGIGIIDNSASADNDTSNQERYFGALECRQQVVGR